LIHKSALKYKVKFNFPAKQALRRVLTLFLEIKKPLVMEWFQCVLICLELQLGFGIGLIFN